MRGRVIGHVRRTHEMPVAVAAPTFTGFKPEAIQFLVDLAANNERAWFQPRKAEYERLLKEPLEALCVALDEEFRARRLPLRAAPGRSPCRIYREVRVSKDKSPHHDKVRTSLSLVPPLLRDLASI